MVAPSGGRSLTLGVWTGTMDVALSQPRSRRLEIVAGNDNRVVAPPGFVLINRLGDGAEGGAWRARYAKDGAQVVAKPVAPTAEIAVQQAFETLRQVGTPNLPTPRALVRAADGLSWLITEWVPGSPLSAGPAPLQAVLADAAALARALAALHEAGTHHGDVAPANVVVDGSRRTLVDLAQLGRRGVGTPGFLAPEVLAGGGGPAADRFALGALIVWRLTGEPPWARPEALLKLRGRADVVARLRALGLGSTPPTLLALLVRLLLPDPEARPASTRDVARCLADLVAAPNEVVGGRLRWWLPLRWSYAGLSLDRAAQTLDDGVTRLLLVCGPPGSGRDRIVEELVLRLQGRGVAALRQDARGWSRDAGAASGSWLEAWVAQAADAAVAGLLSAPLDAAMVPRVRAAARLAKGRVIVPADEAAGRALEGLEGVTVLRPRPLTQEEARRLVSGVVEGSEAEAVADALHAATGGWAPSIVRGGWACAAHEATAEAVPGIVAAAGGQGPGMEAGLALAVLQASWGDPDPSLPATLAPAGRPHAVASAAARAALGPQRVREEARQRRRGRRTDCFAAQRPHGLRAAWRGHMRRR